ncbi:hypothetical protein Hdeb2414_s0006g00199161 [Helianthus debilis subsp. tardiflorus]
MTLTHSPSSCSLSPCIRSKFRRQKPPPPVSGLIRTCNDDGITTTSCSSISPTLLKRKRPTRLDILIGSLTFSSNRSTPVAEDRWKDK